MRFPTPKMVTTATTISFQVYPRAPTGLLLYASQPSASAQRDFLLLGLRQGRALVQINLGRWCKKCLKHMKHIVILVNYRVGQIIANHCEPHRQIFYGYISCLLHERIFKHP